jgi:hypothetical protein
MPAIANVVINDGATTPVAHTFTPLGKDDKGVYWFEQSTPAPANPLGAKRLGYKQDRVLDSNSKQLTGNSRVILTLALPTLEVLGNSGTGITPPPSKAYEEKARIEFTLSERSLLQERKDTRVLFSNFLQHAMVISAIDSLQPSY